MNIPIQENSVNFDDLVQKLADKFPDKTITSTAKNFAVVKVSSTAGANVFLKKKKIMVAGNFPSKGGAMLFTLLMLLLGIIIPLIVYFAVFHGKMKAIEKEVADYIQNEYLKELA